MLLKNCRFQSNERQVGTSAINDPNQPTFVWAALYFLQQQHEEPSQCAWLWQLSQAGANNTASKLLVLATMCSKGAHYTRDSIRSPGSDLRAVVCSCPLVVGWYTKWDYGHIGLWLLLPVPICRPKLSRAHLRLIQSSMDQSTSIHIYNYNSKEGWWVLQLSTRLQQSATMGDTYLFHSKRSPATHVAQLDKPIRYLKSARALLIAPKSVWWKE